MTKKAIKKSAPSYFTATVGEVKTHDSGLVELRLNHDGQPSDKWYAAKLFGGSAPHGTGKRTDTTDPTADPNSIKTVHVEIIKKGMEISIATDKRHTATGPVMEGEGKRKTPRLDVHGNPIEKTTFNLNHFNEIWIRKD